MATDNLITIKLKRVAQSEGSGFINNLKLDYGEPLYISNKGGTNDYLTFGGFNNKPTEIAPEPTETIEMHDQFIKFQSKARIDKQVFYNDPISVEPTSIQLYNDSNTKIYPVILPTVRIKNFKIQGSWIKETEHIYYQESSSNYDLEITTSTRINLSAKGTVLNSLLTNNIYSIHAENIEGKVRIYAFSYTDPGPISLILQASLEEVTIEPQTVPELAVTSIIGDGIVASDGNNIEVGGSLPSSSNKSKLWVDSSSRILYYKNNSEWKSIGGTFG